MRNDCSINFHLSKLSNAKFSILYVISLVRDWQRKLKLITLGSERVKYYNKKLYKKLKQIKCSVIVFVGWLWFCCSLNSQTLFGSAREPGYEPKSGWEFSCFELRLCQFFHTPTPTVNFTASERMTSRFPGSRLRYFQSRRFDYYIKFGYVIPTASGSSAKTESYRQETC